MIDSNTFRNDPAMLNWIKGKQRIARDRRRKSILHSAAFITIVTLGWAFAIALMGYAAYKAMLYSLL